MYTIRATVFLIALTLSGGCASVAPGGLDLDCEGARLRTINIKFKPNDNITVAPSLKKVWPGDAINYLVTGPDTRDFTATGISGPGSVSWLSKTGSGGDGGVSNIVCVPDEQEPGEYKYDIEIVGVGTLDPKVQVQ